MAIRQIYGILSFYSINVSTFDFLIILPNTEHTSNFFLLCKYHYYSGQVFLIKVHTIVLLKFEKGNIKSSITLFFVTVGYQNKSTINC